MARYERYFKPAPNEGPVPAIETPAAGASVWEQGALSLWFYVTFIDQAGDAILLYPLALFFVANYAMRLRDTLPLTFQAWMLIPPAGLAFLSFLWSPAPAAAMKFGLMMLVTLVVVFYLASRFTPAQIARCLFLAGLVAILESLPWLVDFGRAGPWGEKNIFANRMMLIMLASMAVAYDREQPALLRCAGFGAIPVAFAFVVVAKSATALVLAVASFALMTGVWGGWRGLARIQHLRTTLVFLGAASFLLAAFVIANMPDSDIYGWFLDLLGKDSSLTGRTVLWDAARRIAEEKPLLGVGAEGFWFWGRGDAQTLNELMFKAPGTAFSFHSSYHEYRVHLGLFGVVFLFMAMGWTISRSLLGWLRNQTIPQSFLLMVTAIVTAMSLTESLMFSVFDLGVTLFYVSGAMSADLARKKRTTALEASSSWEGDDRPRFRPRPGPADA